ncbi:hypothetical protein AGMMS50239_06490 [Bacteroidia bacterium]|nr:hypothetical protein AGMMS50239_06490 [Bacteroidia bacterium]
MKKHPDYDYRIVRVSLTDIGVNKEAKTIKQNYKEKDPRVNDDLKNACKELAEKYWETSNKENFEKNLHEYKVKVETK